MATRAREVKTVPFQLRVGAEVSVDGRRGEIVAHGPVDEEFGHWFRTLERRTRTGAEPVYAYSGGDLVWHSADEDDDGGTLATSVTPRGLDSLDAAVAEKRLEVDRLEIRRASLLEQVTFAETRLRQAHEDMAAKQLDLADFRERHKREVKLLEDDLERRRQLDAVERGRLAQDLQTRTKEAHAQMAELNAGVIEAMENARNQIQQMAAVTKDINELSAAEATNAATRKLAAATATNGTLDLLNNIEEAAVDNISGPAGASDPRLEFYRIAGAYVKEGHLNGLIEGVFGAFGKPWKKKPAEEDAEDGAET